MSYPENIKTKGLKLIFDDGKVLKMKKKLPQGAFTKAYLGEDGKVYLITRTDDTFGEYSKQILIDINRDTSSVYLPKIELVGYAGDDYTVYRMPYYKAPLRKKDSPKAWDQYKILKKCWEGANRTVKNRASARRHFQQYRNFEPFGHLIMDSVAECIEDKHLSDSQKSTQISLFETIPQALVRAVELLQQHARNYGADYTFEFSPRNLATDKDGHLILLDTVFSQKAFNAKQRRKW